MVMQVYKDDGSSTLFVVSPLFPEPKILRYTEYENWVIDQIVRDYEKNGDTYRDPRPHELAEIFPEGKDYLKTRRKEIAVLLDELLQDDRKIKAEITAFKDRFKQQHLLEMNQIRREKLLEERANNDTILSFMGGKKNKAIENFQVELDKAKAYPIDKLLPFTRRKTTCLWHTDKDPSLYYYKKDNRVHCFVCENGGDSLDVVQQMKGCSLSEAIKFLNHS